MNVIKTFGVVTLCSAGYLALDHFASPFIMAYQAEHPPSKVVRQTRQATDTLPSKLGTMTHAQLSPDCSGHTHCSQMHSCTEAKQWLARCPNAEMDGDNDGIPCERQWCQLGLH
jgi:hypothetical protein